MEARTNGRFKAEYFWGGSLVSRDEEPEAMKAGMIDMATMSTSSYPEKFPIYQICMLPYTCGRVRIETGMAGMEWSELPEPKAELANWGIKLVSPHSFSQYDLIGNSRVEVAEDLDGVRINVGDATFWDPIFNKFGGVTSVIPGPETYDAISKGTFDLYQCTDGCFQAYNMKEVSEYFIKTKSPSGFSLLACNLEAYNALPDDMKKIFDELQQEMPQYIADVFNDADAGLEEQCREVGVEVIEFSDAESAKLQAAAQELVWQQYIDQETERRGLPMQEFFDTWLSLVEKYKGYKK